MSDNHGQHSGNAGESHSHSHDSNAPQVGSYLKVFAALCIFTAVSFVANYFVGKGTITAQQSLMIIIAVAIAKASLVIMIFMNLKYDWRTVYPIMIPVVILTIMMMIILTIDPVLAWHAEYRENESKQMEGKSK